MDSISRKKLITTILNKKKSEISKKTSMINRVTRTAGTNFFPLSNSQMGIWLDIQKNPLEVAYNIPHAYFIKGQLDEDKLCKVLGILAEENEVLRTRIQIVDGIPMQCVDESVEIPVQISSIAHLNDKIAHEFARCEAIKIFDIATDCLLRVAILKSESESVLVMTFHHLICDGWSADLFFSRFSELYDDSEMGRDQKKSEIQYADIAAYASEYLESKKANDQVEYWKAKLENVELGTQYILSDMPQNTEEDNIVKIRFDKTIDSKIRELAKKTGGTPNMILLSVLFILLRNYSDSEDLLVGMPTSGRNIKESEDVLGCFVNSVIIRENVNSKYTFVQLLNAVRNTVLEALDNQDIPIENIVQACEIDLNKNAKSLYSVMYNYVNTKGYRLKLGDLDVEAIEIGGYKSLTDIAFYFYDCESFEGHIEYNHTKYSKRLVQSVAELFVELIRVVSLDSPISELPLGVDLLDVYKSINDTDIEYSNDCVVEQFVEKNMLAYQNRKAIVSLEEEITYGMLYEQIMSIATCLKNQGVDNGDCVCLLSDRNCSLVSAIHAIFYVGATYVPLSVDFPIDRIDYVMHDCCPKLILTDKLSDDLRQVCENNNVLVVNLEAATKTLVEEKPKLICVPESVAYVLYTSGTTGNPKGVAVTQRNLMNYCANNSKSILSEALSNNMTSIVAVTSITFDIHITELVWSLVNGYTIVLADSDRKNTASDFLKLQNVHSVDVLQTTPSRIKLWLNDTQCKCLKNIKLIVLAGEKFEAELARELRAQTDAILINGYGPTETTVMSSKYIVEQENIEKSVPIGKPIANTQLYIMKNDKLCGPDVPGELYIAGDGVSDGYLNLLEMNEQRFIDNPYGSGKMYKTGDYVRLLPDGNIDYIGRNDGQIKLRGFRLELREIELAICDIEEVVDASVIVRDVDGEQDLYAYYITNRDVEAYHIYSHLVNRLPRYMVPVYYLKMDSFPLSFSGKLDKKRLPIIKEPVSIGEKRKAENETQRKLLECFEEVLCVKDIGIDEDFFVLGGNSLRAIKVVNLIRTKMVGDVDLRSFFENSTVVALEKVIHRKINTELIKAEEKLYYEMTSVQARLFYIYMLDSNSIAYNMPSFFEFEGHIDVNRMKNAFCVLIDRHQSLRTAFMMKEETPVQQILNSYEVDVEVLYDKFSTTDELCKDLVRPFNIMLGHVVRMAMVRRKHNWFIMIDFHHIACDGRGIQVFFKELIELYKGNELEPLQYRFVDYSETLKKKSQEEARNHFKKSLKDVPEPQIYGDYVVENTLSDKGSVKHIDFEKMLVDRVLSCAKANGCTLFSVLLSAAFLAISRYSDNDDIVIGVPCDGRNIYGTENMIGMFVNTIPVRANVHQNVTAVEFVKEVAKQLVASMAYVDYGLEQIMSDINGNSKVRNSLFDVIFVMQDSDEELNENSKIRQIFEKHTTAKSALGFNVTYANGHMTMDIEYMTEKFSAKTIDCIFAQYIHVLSELCESNKFIDAIGNIEDKMIPKFSFDMSNLTEGIGDILYQSAIQNASGLAIVDDEVELSYSQFYDKVKLIACNLVEKYGVQKGDYVALIGTNSVNMITALYGVLLSGAAYIPIDQSLPEERITVILSEAKPKMIVYTDQSKIGENEGSILYKELLCNTSNGVVLPKIDLEDAAYIIFTSGSTGKPKGVIVKHIGIINLRNYFLRDLGITKTDKILQFHSIGFDGSVWEINMGILCSATVYIAPSKAKTDGEYFEQFFKKSGITIASLPPAFYESIGHIYPRIIVTAGSSATTSVVKKALNDGVRYVNSYGPTEATVAVTHWEPNEWKIPNRIPIGRPIYNTAIYIMKNKHICPVGVVGEICISTPALAVGYLGDKKLTEAKFVDNPFGDGRIYKTGDLGRYLHDGTIEFYGRIDKQVKLRGYRIELDEISSVIRKVQGVKDAATIEKDGNILSYYTVDSKLDKNTVITALKQYLPSYMQPNSIMRIDEITYTINGKLDIGSLPPIITINDNFVQPESHIEEVVAGIFSDILGIGKFSVTDCFMELGGDSIRSLKLAARLKSIGIDVSITQIMQKGSVREIARLFDKHSTSNQITLKYLPYSEKNITKQQMFEFSQTSLWRQISNYESCICNAETNKRYQLLSIQKRYKSIYNYTRFSLDESVDVHILQEALNKLIMIQSAFRTVVYSEYAEEKQLEEIQVPIIMEAVDVTLIPAIAELLFKYNGHIGLVPFAFKNVNCWEIWIVAHHCLWDYMSSYVVRHIIEDELNGLSTGTKFKLSEYYETKRVQEKNYLPVVRDTFNCMVIKEKKHFVKNAYCTFMYEENRNRFADNGAIESMIDIFSKINRLEDDIPFLLVHHRRNANHFFRCGLLIDLVPCVYNGQVVKPENIDEKGDFYEQLMSDLGFDFEYIYGIPKVNYIDQRNIPMDYLSNDTIEIEDSIDNEMTCYIFNNGIRIKIPILDREDSWESLNQDIKNVVLKHFK